MIVSRETVSSASRERSTSAALCFALLTFSTSLGSESVLSLSLSLSFSLYLSKGRRCIGQYTTYFHLTPSMFTSRHASKRLKTCSQTIARRSIETYTRRTPPPPPAEVLTLLQAYQGQPPHNVPLAKVTSFGEDLSPDSVVASANFVLEEIPRRLAQRVRSLDNLPFIVGTNPFITRMHDLYRTSFKVSLLNEWDLYCIVLMTMDFW